MNSTLGDDYPEYIMLFPTFAYGRALGLLMAAGSHESLWVCAGYLYGTGTITLLGGIYLHLLLPGKYGISEDLFSSCIKQCCTDNKVKDLEHRRSGTKEAQHSDASDIIQDIDVLAEATRAGQMDPSDCAVVVQNLRKTYGEHVAVKNLSVCFESNECFGLLGPNGAGALNRCC